MNVDFGFNDDTMVYELEVRSGWVGITLAIWLALFLVGFSILGVFHLASGSAP